MNLAQFKWSKTELKRRNDGYLRLRTARGTGRTTGGSKRRDLVSFGSEGRAAAADGHSGGARANARGCACLMDV